MIKGVVRSHLIKFKHHPKGGNTHTGYTNKIVETLNLVISIHLIS